MATVYLAFGSNIGDREKYIRDAMMQLEASGVKIMKLSTIIETDPVGGPAQGRFLNAVAKVETGLSPQELLVFCLKVETGLGRVRDQRHGPRIIDIDILLYDNLQVNTPELTIPHPRMWERAFVMRPLLEIEPGIKR